MRPISFRNALPVLAAALALAAPTLPSAAQTVPLHVRDCDVAPGGLAVIVVEVCQPRPISQGQICLVTPGLDRLKRVKVESTRSDAVASAEIAGADEIAITFFSPSASINEEKGPLAIIAFRLDPSLPPGYETLVTVDLAGTTILDAAGMDVPTAPTPGRLRIRQPNDPFVIYPFSDYGLVGDSAIVEVATRERQRVRQMIIDFEYETDFFGSVRDVHFFPKAADLVTSVDLSEPGHVKVRMRSDSTRLNDVPGSLFWVELVRRADGSEEADGEIDLPEDECAVRLADGEAIPIETLEYEIR